MTEDLQRQFAALKVAVQQTEVENDKVPVWPENWPSVFAFLECQTQWRTAATMRSLIWVGLDYAAVQTVLDAESLGREIFADLRTMEAAALPVLNEGD
jgi:hypothetical protein